MKSECSMQESQIVQLTVMNSDGSVDRREMPVLSQRARPQGKLVFPFEHGSVHSTAWCASEHAVFITGE